MKKLAIKRTKHENLFVIRTKQVHDEKIDTLNLNSNHEPRTAIVYFLLGMNGKFHTCDINSNTNVDKGKWLCKQGGLDGRCCGGYKNEK